MNEGIKAKIAKLETSLQAAAKQENSSLYVTPDMLTIEEQGQLYKSYCIIREGKEPTFEEKKCLSKIHEMFRLKQAEAKLNPVRGIH